MKRLSLFFLISSLFFCLIVWAGDKANEPKAQSNRLCGLLLGDATIIPEIDDFLRPRAGFKHDTHAYQHRGALGAALDIRNQRSFGSCWAHAGLRIFELRALRATGHDTPLSADYLIAMHLLDSVLQAVKDPKIKLSEGAFLDRPTVLGGKYGMMPASAWTPRIPIASSRAIIRRLLFHLNIVINDSRIDYEDLPQNEGREDALRKFSQATSKKALAIIEAFTGPIPHSFEFEDKTITPAEFFTLARYGAPKNSIRRVISVTDQRRGALALFQRIRAQLDTAKEPVAVSIQWEPTFIDGLQGIASIAAFNPYTLDSPERLDLAAQIAAISSGDDGGSHVVVIIDYSVDKDGNPTRLLAMNSHGPDSGDSGYLHIYWDYFETYAQAAYLLKPYLSP